MVYQESKEYAKYLQSQITSSSECSDCTGSSTTEDCGCCPAGLIAVYDGEGNRLGCLTPADAEAYNAANRTCAEGFLALYKNGTPNVFLGCVSEAEYGALYLVVNPVV
jgi:hypothetical protein